MPHQQEQDRPSTVQAQFNRVSLSQKLQMLQTLHYTISAQLQVLMNSTAGLQRMTRDQVMQWQALQQRKEIIQARLITLTQRSTTAEEEVQQQVRANVNMPADMGLENPLMAMPQMSDEQLAQMLIPMVERIRIAEHLPPGMTNEQAQEIMAKKMRLQQQFRAQAMQQQQRVVARNSEGLGDEGDGGEETPAKDESRYHSV